MSLMIAPAPRRVRTRVTARLTLEINGVEFDVVPMSLGEDPQSENGQSVNGFEHSLRRRGDARWFQVFDRNDADFRTVFYCQSCGRDGCHHAIALDQVGLMG